MDFKTNLKSNCVITSFQSADNAKKYIKTHQNNKI